MFFLKLVIKDIFKRFFFGKMLLKTETKIDEINYFKLTYASVLNFTLKEKNHFL